MVSDFCVQNGAQYLMRSIDDVGIQELFIPSVDEGDVYKLAATTPEGQRRDKVDPMAHTAELPPVTGSIVTSSDYTQGDQARMGKHADTGWTEEPISIYEVHLDSWRQGLSYEIVAEKLVRYTVDMNYIHVEFMSVSEHPSTSSWGYQVPGYYVPTSRYGTSDQSHGLVDAFHTVGIGVVMGWVPGYFPKDESAFTRFGDTVCCEHPDWRRGEQYDRGTYVFDFNHNKVHNLLYANALYWAEEFYIGSLCIDTMASMLHLDYSRNEGEWLLNQYGGHESLDVIQLPQEFNATIYRRNPGFLTAAEESTSWPGVIAPTEHGSLSFPMEWNMGRMNDTLGYFSEKPTYCFYHYYEFTFVMVYAYLGEFILPTSHSEVVYDKGSL